MNFGVVVCKARLDKALHCYVNLSLFITTVRLCAFILEFLLLTCKSFFIHYYCTIMCIHYRVVPSGPIIVDRIRLRSHQSHPIPPFRRIPSTQSPPYSPSIIILFHPTVDFYSVDTPIDCSKDMIPVIPD